MTDEEQKAYYRTMSQAEFKTKLVEFFERHDPEAIRAVPEIAKEFDDRKLEVFGELTERYAASNGKPGTYVSLLGGPPMGSNAGNVPV